MNSAINYSFILLTIILTVYGQVVIKWQVIRAGDFPSELFERTSFLLHLIINPWIISALLAAFIAALSWMVAMTKFDLSHAYPFMSLSFIIVLFSSGLFFNEAITSYKVIGLFCVIIGIIIGSQG